MLYRTVNKKVQLVIRLLTATVVLLVLFFSTDFNKKKIPKKKQIILISIDTLRGDHLSSYGYSRDTSPHLSQLGKDSTYYINAYANSSWTMPSHMSLLTGTLPSRHGVNSFWGTLPHERYPKLNRSLKSIAEILKAHHIDTMKFALLPDELGFAKGFAKNNRYDPFFVDNGFNNVLQELENYKDKDFFLFIHTWMVHAPYSNCYFLEKEKISEAKKNYIDNFRKYSPEKGNLVEEFQRFLQENHLFNPDDCMTLYDSGIHYVDRYIGKIIDKTRQLGIYEELLLIIVSDHGEHFDEHYANNFYSFHGKDFFEEFIKVPLIIKYPFKFRSGILTHPVSLVDVFPTILDFYEFEIPAFVQGDSLLKPYPRRDRKYIISEAISEGNIETKMIRIGDLKYMITMIDPQRPERVNWEAITRRRLFNLKNDPLEQRDLYSNLKFRRICMELEKKLTRIIKNSAKSNRRRQKTTISKETIKQLKTLGYL
jgi:arylsulfatase A-like enzyme